MNAALFHAMRSLSIRNLVSIWPIAGGPKVNSSEPVAILAGRARATRESMDIWAFVLMVNMLACKQDGISSTFPAELRTATLDVVCLLPREVTVNWTMNDADKVESGAEAEMVGEEGADEAMT